MEIVTLFVSLITLIAVVVLFFKIRSSNKSDIEVTVEKVIREKLKEDKVELAEGLRANREELNKSILVFQQSVFETLQKMSQTQTVTIERLTENTENRLNNIVKAFSENGKLSREELSASLEAFSRSFTSSVKEFNELQKEKFNLMTQKQDELVKQTEEKLEKMRETVDEKLNKTLEERLGRSFKMVSERLEAVQKGLGEMQTLANGVGDLKKVLSNVKTRGVLGEIQLGNILEQILAPEQYDINVKTKKGSKDLVEFAIKLPGKSDDGLPVWLPVDAKFPQEDYIRLQSAYENADTEAVEQATKALLKAVKKSAKDIRDKYIEPPYTTDFGIMFLPVEGLYAEVVRQPGLVLYLQKEYKIVVTGPTTLAAMLNSLQMGFRTLAIQKRTSEVWNVLGAVKNQFRMFGEVLKKAQDKIKQADRDIEELVTTRTNMMMSKLKKVEELPEQESTKIIGTGKSGGIDDDFES